MHQLPTVLNTHSRYTSLSIHLAHSISQLDSLLISEALAERCVIAVDTSTGANIKIDPSVSLSLTQKEPQLASEEAAGSLEELAFAHLPVLEQGEEQDKTRNLSVDEQAK